jgi:hypothetical protein
MRIIRKFVVELILAGILVGWLIWKFPEAVDQLIPWIVWAILAHITWEICNESEAMRMYAGVASRKRMVWLIAFALGGLLSVGYLWIAKLGMSKLNAVAANGKQSEAPAEKPPQPKPTEHQPENPPPTSTEKLEESEPELNSDLTYIFHGKDRLWYAFVNPTEHAANKPNVSFGLMNLTNPYKYAPQNGTFGIQPYPIPVKVMVDDYVRPHESGGDEVLGQFANQIKAGDVIFGASWITCINCKKRRGYYLYWKVGDGGWYAEVPLKGMQLPRSEGPATDMQIKEYVDKLVPFEKRTPIKQQFENPWGKD